MQAIKPPLVDIGANLGHDSFDNDIEEVITSSREAGLKHIMVTGTDVPSTEKALRLVERFGDYLSATSGIHPHHAGESSAEDLDETARLAREAKVRAVGETGLDFFRDFSPRPAQEKVFTRLLELAAGIGKPLFLHQRDAHERFLPILKEYRDALPAGGVVHCFTGSREELYDYLDLDMYIGITGWICDERRGAHLLPLVRDIPPDRLLLETDAPYLLPRTLRPRPKSRRNEPRHLPAVLATVASCLRTDGQQSQPETELELARRTTANACRLFQLPVDDSSPSPDR